MYNDRSRVEKQVYAQRMRAYHGERERLQKNAKRIVNKERKKINASKTKNEKKLRSRQESKSVFSLGQHGSTFHFASSVVPFYQGSGDVIKTAALPPQMPNQLSVSIPQASTFTYENVSPLIDMELDEQPSLFERSKASSHTSMAMTESLQGNPSHRAIYDNDESIVTNNYTPLFSQPILHNFEITPKQSAQIKPRFSPFAMTCTTYPLDTTKTATPGTSKSLQIADDSNQCESESVTATLDERLLSLGKELLVISKSREDEIKGLSV